MNTETVSKAVNSRLVEFLEAYVLVGYVAGTNKPIVVKKIHDEEQMKLLVAAVVKPTCAWNLPSGKLPCHNLGLFEHRGQFYCGAHYHAAKAV